MSKLTRQERRGREQEQPAKAPPIAVRALRDPSVADADQATWILCLYLMVIMGGYALLLVGHVTPAGNEFTRDRACFLACNAATLTGFQTTLPFNDSDLGPLILFGLTLAGTLTSLVVGSMAVVRILGLPYSRKQIWTGAGICCGASLVLGALWGMFSSQGAFNGSLITFDAFANGGACSRKAPALNSMATHLLLMPLAVFGGLGLPVLMELFDVARKKRQLSMHGRTVIVMTAGLYLVALVLFTWLNAPRYSDSWGPARANVASASVAAVNSRTAGLPLFDAQTFPPVMQWLMVGLMMIGASPAGTGGGMKTTTIVELFRGVRRSARGDVAGKAFAIAATWVTIYLVGSAVTFLLLLWAQPDLKADRILFQSISAVSNVGLSLDQLSATGVGLFVLSAAMLFGRITPLLVLWWMAGKVNDAQLAVG